MCYMKKNYLVFIGIFVVIVAASIATLYYEGSKAEKEIAIFQDMFNEYLDCSNGDYAECQCDYLIKRFCEKFDGRRAFDMDEGYFLEAKLIRNITGILDLEKRGINISESGYTHKVILMFSSVTGTSKGDCLTATYFKEEGEWRLYDIDMPFPASYCDKK